MIQPRLPINTVAPVLLASVLLSLASPGAALAQPEQPATPIIAVDPSFINFGMVQVGSCSTPVLLRVFNNGDPGSVLHLTAVSISGADFVLGALPPLPVDLAVGGPIYGDIVGEQGECRPNGIVDLGDILAVLDAFRNIYGEDCTLEGADLAPCEGDGVIELIDVLAVLDAFQGMDNCLSNAP